MIQHTTLTPQEEKEKRKMNSLELLVIEPYENGELKPHTVGIIREIEEKNKEYEIEDTFERKELRKGLEIRLIKKFDKLILPFSLSLTLTHFHFLNLYF